MGSLVKGIFFYLVFSLKKEKNKCVKGKLVIICEQMLFMEAMVCKQKIMGRNCVQ
jgi:hypothetical protein